MRLSHVLGLALWPSLVWSLASTDTPQDADFPQSGYLPNHQIDPTRLGSWTKSWQAVYNTNEVFYAKPLVYTPTGFSHELVILVSNQNIVRIVDGMTGSLITSRTLVPPFASSDTNCGDIPNTVGITGTPIIDTATDIMYFLAKGYQNGQAGPQGTIFGEYYAYALNIPSLTDIPGFPITLSGHNAANDPTRYFVPGTVLQRPGLTMIGNSIVAGFGGHCDNFNYTGMLVTVSKTSGGGVTNVVAMEASPGAPSPQPLDITVQGGGKAGIWQSGMGLAADLSNNRIFFSTGNGVGPGQNGGANGQPASGRVYLSTLEQAIANFGVNPSSGTLTQQDYFEPANYDSLNGGDRDIGSSGVALLASNPFSGGGVNRVAITGSKAGNLYVMDADNLGGFKMGAGNTDAILQTLTFPNPFYNGIGSYPLDGGYIYVCPTSSVLSAYKLTFDGSGRPQFTLAGQTSATFACTGTPTVTSLNDQAGTGVVWMADVNQGLVAFNAVPVNGVLQPITLPSTGRLMKFHRPAFGNNRAYVSRTNTVIAVGGSPQSVSASSSTISTTSSTSPSSSSSTSTATSSSVSSASTSSSSSSTTQSSGSSASSSTGPSSVSASTTLSASITSTTSGGSSTATPTDGYYYIGCFRDTSSGPHALPLLFRNNSVTPELCLQYAQALANAPTPTVLPYVYVEFHRECYGGSVWSFGSSSITSLTGTKACTDICSGSIGASTTGTAKCGGSQQFNLYALSTSVSFPGPVATTAA